MQLFVGACEVGGCCLPSIKCALLGAEPWQAGKCTTKKRQGMSILIGTPAQKRSP